MSLSGLRGTEIGAMVVCLSLLGVVCYVLSDDVDLVVGGFVFKLLRRVAGVRRAVERNWWMTCVETAV